VTDERLSEQHFHRSRFDRFGEAASRVVSRGGFFTFCVAIVLLWLVSYFVIPSKETWQLVINTITTIVTFILVALLQNAQRRSEVALQAKLNAIADGLADLMEHEATGEAGDLMQDMEDLRVSSGLEDRT
jgi:low affinity Fe/Cu permease